MAAKVPELVLLNCTWPETDWVKLKLAFKLQGLALTLVMVITAVAPDEHVGAELKINKFTV